jgi:hypothetical protein
LGLDEISHPLAFMCTEVVEDDYLPRVQCRRQETLHIRLENHLVGGALEGHRLSHTTEGQTRDQRRVLTAVARNPAVRPLALRRSCSRTRHARVGATFVDEQEATGIEAPYQFAPARPLFLVAFRGREGLFLSGHSPGSRRMLRLIVAVETRTPR